MKEIQLTMHHTKCSIVAAIEQQQKYCFSSASPAAEKACIGHIRGDFGETGKSFYTSWWPHNQELLTDCFHTELQNMISALQRNGLLKDRPTMNSRIYQFPQAVIRSEYTKQLAFRIDTPKNIYFLRCNPNKGEYNFYLYAYERNAMEKAMQMDQKQRVMREER